MNVLVYAGPEVVQNSLDHTLATLRFILLPFYSVQSISQKALATQPWQKSCALLAFPGCRDAVLSKAAPEIERYVQDGGSFLAFGTGTHYSSRGLDQGILPSKDMLLRFFDRQSSKTLYPTFQHGTLQGARAVAIIPTGAIEEPIDCVLQSSVSEFAGIDEDTTSVHVLARYTDAGRVAGALYTFGNGKAVLWGPSPEYPLTEEPVSSLNSGLSPADIEVAEQRRRALVRNTLLLLGLQIPESSNTIRQPLPQFLVSHSSKPGLVSAVTDALGGAADFEDANDRFRFHALAESDALLAQTRAAATTGTDPSTWQPKHVVVCPEGQLPSPEQTPLFDLTLFFNALSAARNKEGVADDPHRCSFGDILFYGEAVTSTQTMLDKNPRFMGLLTAPLLSLASHQLAGRGRGANVWLSPSGCLQFSLLLRLSLATFSANKLVFVQYLFALAVVEACHASGATSVQLKWPNDIYAATDEGPKKIGGILVNTSFGGGKVEIVIGSGLNVLNPPPITSLAQLGEQSSAPSMERTGAAILVKFERMWDVFVEGKGSFEPFMELYLQRWMHSDQLVTLTTTSPEQQVRILGITPDHGLLRTVGAGGAFVDLQPDGNSFDLMAGLINAKT
ncbi:BPL/LPL catalytic domain-containing protein [Mycena kentingensis (nom. inval.)]|nr:BPL/LPL catalytic domain-containing protein [Mycena kentingensis (nom. inval.)]